jgi:hypothetical protein
MLFIAAGCRIDGTFNSENGTVDIHQKQAAENEDLLEIAAIQTYLNGGSVFILPANKMPEPKATVAVFRY